MIGFGGGDDDEEEDGSGEEGDAAATGLCNLKDVGADGDGEAEPLATFVGGGFIKGVWFGGGEWEHGLALYPVNWIFFQSRHGVEKSP